MDTDDDSAYAELWTTCFVAAAVLARAGGASTADVVLTTVAVCTDFVAVALLVAIAAVNRAA